MCSATKKPVTVKHRIGINGRESYEELAEFVRIISQAGPARLIVHARIAILDGLSPKENRSIPPLRYDDVYKLKRDFPDSTIEVNGGIETLDQVATHLEQVDGVMIGRAAFDHPWLFREVDRRFYGTHTPLPTRREVINGIKPYLDHWQEEGRSLHTLIRPLLGLFAFEPGTRRFKQKLSGKLDEATPLSGLLDRATAHISDEVLDR
jgi:tRNA-dihydrouridine synthase A